MSAVIVKVKECPWHTFPQVVGRATRIAAILGCDVEIEFENGTRLVVDENDSEGSAKHRREQLEGSPSDTSR